MPSLIEQVMQPKIFIPSEVLFWHMDMKKGGMVYSPGHVGEMRDLVETHPVQVITYSSMPMPGNGENCSTLYATCKKANVSKAYFNVGSPGGLTVALIGENGFDVVAKEEARTQLEMPDDNSFVFRSKGYPLVAQSSGENAENLFEFARRVKQNVPARKVVAQP